MTKKIRMHEVKTAATDAITRREFAKRAVARPAAHHCRVDPRFLDNGDAADTLKVGFISPRSGPLAGFGEPDPYVIGLVRKSLAKGFEVGGKTYAVEIIDKDTQSDPARAGQLAKELITSGAIDFMLKRPHRKP